MKSDHKLKAEKTSPKVKADKAVRQVSPKTNGKHPLATYEHIPIGIVECALDGKYMDVNDEFCRITGYTRSALLRRGIKDLTHEDDYALDIKLFEELVAGQIPFYRLEKRYVRKDGSSIWVELTRSLVRNTKGKPLYSVGVALDISERKQVERVLRESAERLRLATEAAQIFTWEWDFQNNSYSLSDNFTQILGFQTDLLAKNPFETIGTFVPAEDLQSVSNAFQKVVANQRDLQSLPCRVINPKDGQIVWLEISAKIVYDLHGNPTRMFGVAQNITESKNIQSEMAVISRMPEENPNPVMRIHRDGKILYANPASAALLEDWMQGLRPIIPDELQTAIKQTFTSGRKMETDFWHRGKHYSFTVVPLVDSGYVNLYGKDITESKKAEQALRSSEERMRLAIEANRMVAWEWDVANDRVTTSENFAEVYGLSAAAAALDGAAAGFALIWPEDLAAHREKVDRIIRHGGEYHSEFRVTRPVDGRRLWIEERATALMDASGQVTRLVGVVTDITKRKQAEAVLAEYARQQESLYRLSDRLHRTEAFADVFDAALDAILNALHCDRAAILLYDDIDVMRFVAWRGLSDAYRQSTEGHSPWNPDAIHPKPISMDDVRTADLSESLRVVIEEEGIGALAFIPLVVHEKLIGKFMIYYNAPHTFNEAELDLSLTIANQLAFGIDRKRAGQALERERELLERLFETMPVMVSMIDPATNSMRLNTEFEQRIGWKAEEVTVVSLLEALYPDPEYRQSVLQRMAAAANTNEWVEVQVRTREGRTMDSMWANISIMEDDKLITGIALGVDITERKRTEEALRESEKRFREVFETAGVSVWVEDFTEVKRAIEGLRTQDVRDFRAYFEQNPDFVQRAIGQVRILDVNNETLELFGARNKEDLLGSLSNVFTPETESVFVEELVALAEGQEILRAETQLQTLAGQRLSVLFTIHFGLQDSDQNRVVVTLMDITARKRAEEALRQSEERFARFMQHLPGLAWIKDIQGRYVYANAAAVKAFSTPGEQLYGKTDEEIFPLEIAASFKENDQRALAEGQGVQVIETLVQEDGVLHSSLVSKFPIPGPDGSPALIGGTAFDITERLQAEEALRESEERFSAILRQATAGIVRKDVDGRLLFVNQAFCNMLGYNEQELIGKTMWEVMYPEDVAENKKSYSRLMAEGIPFKLERRLLRADGSVIWVDASVSPIMDSTGTPQSAVAVEVDITGRKQAEEALRELNLQLEDRVFSRTARLREVNQTLREEITERKRIEEALRQSEFAARTNEEKLQTLFDLLPVGISFLSPEGQIIQMNSALPNLVKLPKKELLSQMYKSRKYIRADGRQMSAAELASARALAEGRTIHNVETGIVLENGEVIWTNVSAAPVDVADVGVVVVTVDITDSKRAERALQESHQRLRILSQRLVEVQEDERRALARELHDRVGQTLAALNINLIIINSQLSGEAAEQIGTRLNDSMKLVAETIALVRDVMTDLRPAVLDDYGLEAALESHLSQFISRYGISAKLEKPDQPLPRLGPSVEMTMLRIAQEALMNIARHAKATEVILSLRQRANTVSLTIQDNGIGIESWQDANRPGSHGLTIMRERAEAFDGSLRVKSVPGQGTVVAVTIPFTRDVHNEVQEQKDL